MSSLISENTKPVAATFSFAPDMPYPVYESGCLRIARFRMKGYPTRKVKPQTGDKQVPLLCKYQSFDNECLSTTKKPPTSSNVCVLTRDDLPYCGMFERNTF